jgi:hypothetical protein
MKSVKRQNDKVATLYFPVTVLLQYQTQFLYVVSRLCCVSEPTGEGN